MSTPDKNNNINVIEEQNLTPTAKGRGTLLQEARRFINMKSPEKEMTLPPVLECICHRKIMGILCRSCGNTFRGRMRKVCRFHPTSRYLMDYEVCPTCKATQLREFEECLTEMDCEKERNT